MTTERDPGTRIVLSWLREDAHENAERVLLRALDEVDTTPQRRSWWPAWRSEHMRTTQILVAAAAVLVVAFLGYSLLPGIGGPGQPQTTPTVAPTATPLPTSYPILPLQGSVPPGTYTVSTFTNRAFTVTVPAGWRGDNEFIVKGDGAAEEEVFDGTGVALVRWTITHVYTDSCQWEGTLQEVTTAGDIARALSEQAGHETTVSVGTTLGGEPAVAINLSLPAAFDVAACDSSFVRLWPDAGPDEAFGLPIYPGQTSSVYVVDHGATATMIIAIINEESTSADVAELESVLASLEFQP